MTTPPQPNQYDKIFRENMEAALPGLIRDVLRIEIVTAEELPDDRNVGPIQHTKERKPDLLKKVTDVTGETFILHLEIQTKNESDMVYRMAEYFVMLHREYRLPVRQYVLYIGAGQPGMTTQLRVEPMQFSYNLLALSAVSYRLFLASTVPEQVLLAILADFDNQPPEVVIRQMASRLAETAPGDFAFRKPTNQLRVLAQLRKLRQLTNQIMDSVLTFFREEDDPLFILGEQRGELRGEQRAEQKVQSQVRKLVLNLLAKSGLSVAQIADIAEVPVEFVQQLQQENL
jgi:predicted transposase YdaD